MALIWADGFDDYDYDVEAAAAAVAGEYESYSDTGTSGSNDLSVVASGRRGSGALQLLQSGSGTSPYVQKTLPAAITELFAAVAYNPGSNTNAQHFLSLWSGPTCQITLTKNTAGAIEVRRGTSAGTLLATSGSGVLPVSQFTHMSVRAVISSTVGIVQIRLNGAATNAIDISAANTNNGASAVSVDGVRLGPSVSGLSVFTMLFDDLVLWDTTNDGSGMTSWIGDVRVDSYAPNAEGDTQNFTTSAGTAHYSLVNGASPVAANYVQSANVGDVDLFQFADMLHTPAAIYGVMATAAALKDDAGSRSIRMKCKSGSTTTDNGTDLALSTTRTRVKGAFGVNPATGAAWTKAGFNSAQFGVAVTV